MRETAARPTDAPNCDSVLNTAPARACVLSGKLPVMMSAETTNKTIVRETSSVSQPSARIKVGGPGRIERERERLLSPEMGDKSTAQKPAYQ